MNQFYKKFNPSFDFLPIKKIKQIQFKKIKKILEYSLANSEFYKNLYKNMGIDINEIKNFDDFKHLPIIAKEDLRNNNWSFSAAKRAKWIDVSVTSGTTGEPIYLPWTEKDFGHMANITFLLHKTAGIKKEDVVQITYPIGAGMWIAGLHNWLGLCKIGACSLRFGPGFSDAQVENMLKMKPTVLLGSPSFLLKLGLLAKEKGIIRKIMPKIACVSGENVLTIDLKKNELGKKLEEVWDGAIIKAVFGASEGPICGIECNKNQGYHIPAEYFYLEILDYTTHSVLPEGEKGMLVITTLNAEAMPLIRYALGDITFRLEKKCPCGRVSPRLGPILGRVDRLIKIKGLLINPDEIGRILSSMNFVKTYYIEVLKDKNYMDTLRICVSIDKNNQILKKIVINSVKESIKTKIRINVDIIIKSYEEIVKRINLAQFDRPYHKPCVFFDLRNKQ